VSRSRTPLRALLNKRFRPPPTEGGTSSAHFRSILAAFVGLGFHVGVWAVLLADLAGALALGPGALGVALSVMTASGIAALLVGGRLADRLGRRPFLLLGAGGTGVLFLVLVPASGSGGYVALLAVLAFGGVCASSWDLAVNALGGDHKRQHGGRVMTPLHAGFSGAAAAGALLSGAALWAGVGFGAVYATVGVGLLALAAILGLVPLPRREPLTSNGTGPEAGETRGPSLLLVPAVAACALIVFMAFSTDAVVEGFLSVDLRDVLSSGALLGGRAWPRSTSRRPSAAWGRRRAAQTRRTHHSRLLRPRFGLRDGLRRAGARPGDRRRRAAPGGRRRLADRPGRLLPRGARSRRRAAGRSRW
jgi:MFS family permease